MATRHKTDTDTNTILQAAQLAPPPMWRVVLLNDDFTPMDYVVGILREYFAMDTEQATRVMLKVHTEGRGICGIFAKDVAATKVAAVTQDARLNQHPLQCIMEVNE
jgi:ATP-dependent Clp protease adaptor protein ClpS